MLPSFSEKFKRSKRVLSFIQTYIYVKKNWWKRCNRIEKNLYLTKIPDKQDRKEFEKFSEDNQDKYHDDKLGLVVSVNEEYELNEPISFMSTPIKPIEWLEKGIEHHRLDIPDFKTKVKFDEAVDTLLKIEAYRHKRAVIIHCKAGRSRSTTIMAAFLAVFELKEKNPTASVQDLVKLAKAQITANRHNINFSSKYEELSMKIIEETLKTLHEQPERLQRHKELAEERMRINDERSSLREKIETCVTEEKLIIEIKKLPSYIALVKYRDKLLEDETLFKSILKTPKRAEYVNDIINAINKADSAQWYFDLLTGPLILATPYVTTSDVEKDKETRKDLMINLKEDIENLVSTKLGMSFERLHVTPVNQEQKSETLSLKVANK